MNGAFEVSAAALRAEQAALEILANNIANANTPAFKRSDARFAEVLAAQVRADGRIETAPDAANTRGSGIRIVPRDLLFLQGDLRATGNPLDLAIDGIGFVEIMGPAGQNLLWRGGSLRVTDDGLLATLDGMPLRAGITVPLDAEELSIDASGVVRAATAAGEVIEIGQISLVRTESDDQLERLDSGLLRVKEGARLVEAMPGEDGVGTIVQGSLEESNVELTAEMVQLLVIQRSFAATAQVIQTADQLAAISNNLKQ